MRGQQAQEKLSVEFQSFEFLVSSFFQSMRHQSDQLFDLHLPIVSSFGSRVRVWV